MKFIRVLLLAMLAATLSVLIIGCTSNNSETESNESNENNEENNEGELESEAETKSESGNAVLQGTFALDAAADAANLEEMLNYLLDESFEVTDAATDLGDFDPRIVDDFETSEGRNDYIIAVYKLIGLTAVIQRIIPTRTNEPNSAGIPTPLINNDVGLKNFFALTEVTGGNPGRMARRLSPRDWSAEQNFYFWARISEDSPGGQTVKVYLASNGVVYISPAIAVENVRSANGFYKIPFTDFESVNGGSRATAANFSNVTGFMLEINKGSMWVDDFRAGSHPIPVRQQPILDNQAVLAALPTTVQLVGGANTTAETASLFAFLKGVTGHYTLFGAHDANRTDFPGGRHVAFRNTGSFPAVMSFDAYGDIHRENITPLVLQAHREGSIITLCAHMRGLRPNESPGRTEGTFRAEAGTVGMVTAILTEGSIERRNLERFFDDLAEWANTLYDDYGRLIPVIFRPWHEHSGDWFWWGRGHCTPDEFVALWRFTVHSLRDRGVVNFLYAFSPNTTFTRESYIDPWWPGDAYVDILGFDGYFQNTDFISYRNRLIEHNRIVLELAAERGKVAALTEFGNNSNLPGVDAATYLDYLDLVNEMIAQDALVPYMAIWRSSNRAYIPYRAHGLNPAHPNLYNFINFYNHPNVAFADRLQGILELPVTVEAIPTEPEMDFIIVSPESTLYYEHEIEVALRLLTAHGTFNIETVTARLANANITGSEAVTLVFADNAYRGTLIIPEGTPPSVAELLIEVTYNSGYTRQHSMEVAIGAFPILREFNFANEADGTMGITWSRFANGVEAMNGREEVFRSEITDAAGHVHGVLDLNAVYTTGDWGFVQLSLPRTADDIAAFSQANGMRYDVLIAKADADAHRNLHIHPIMHPGWVEMSSAWVRHSDLTLRSFNDEYYVITLSYSLEDVTLRADGAFMVLRILNFTNSRPVYVTNIQFFSTDFDG